MVGFTARNRRTSFLSPMVHRGIEAAPRSLSMESGTRSPRFPEPRGKDYRLSGSRGLSSQVVLLFSVAVLVAGELLAQVTRGPYLQTGTSSSTIVRWRTTEPSEG